MSWGLLREGLLSDLALDSAEALATKIDYHDTEHLAAALARETPPSDDLMAALLRHYLTVPSLYFAESGSAA